MSIYLGKNKVSVTNTKYLDYDVQSVVDEAKGTQVLVVNGKNDAVEPLDITQNGKYNVARYKEVNVNVADMLQERVDDTNSCAYLFYKYYGKNTDIAKGLNTSNVTSMASMFYGCSNLTTINLSNLDTSNVETMYEMFAYSNALTNLDLSNFDTSKVETMYSMFNFCSKLTNLDLSSFNTSNITTMYQMFYNCYLLTNITFGENFNTSSVTNMSSMFNSCQEIPSLDLSNFDTSKVSNMYALFNNCYKLSNIVFGEKFDTSNVTNMGMLFYNCKALTSLDLSHFDMTNASTGSMFNGCTALTNVILPSTIKKMDNDFFKNCTSLTEFTILAETPPRLNNSTTCISTATTSIYVPDASVEAYKTATNWSAYADKIKPLSSKGV